jgi:hypothetical protein
MKAENIQSNTSAPRLAGSAFAKFEQDQDGLLVDKLLTHAKGIHTKHDVEEFLTGYVEGLAGDANSKKVRKSMVRKILVVLTATDKKLNEYHKLSKPSDGQKLVRSKMKVAKGINALSAALRVPSAPKVEGEGESEPTAKDAKDLPTLWSTFMGDALTNGHTKDDIAAFLATLDLSK